jgi:hypothetical protein
MQRYRLTVFNKPCGPWRQTRDEVLADAVALDLAAWDASKREHFLAVPCDCEMEATRWE